MQMTVMSEGLLLNSKYIKMGREEGGFQALLTQLPLVIVCHELKEQYPVTAHAPNFDFWTGCREIKRCEESKRILKNPFASRLAGFNTILKLLRIIDQ